jgi:hypothetical protein
MFICTMNDPTLNLKLKITPCYFDIFMYVVYRKAKQLVIGNRDNTDYCEIKVGIYFSLLKNLSITP